MFGEISLYSANGGYLRVSPQKWAELLALARRSGWAPKGTGKPPVSLDIDHECAEPEAGLSSYNTPRGQMVRESDAFALAMALERSEPDPDGFTHRLCGFCHMGAFLICQEQALPKTRTRAPGIKQSISFSFNCLHKRLGGALLRYGSHHPTLARR